jgi:hypothetical protein
LRAGAVAEVSEQRRLVRVLHWREGAGTPGRAVPLAESRVLLHVSGWT